MPDAFLLTVIILGAVGLYLALPGGRANVGKLALVVLLGAGGALFGMLARRYGSDAVPGWFVVLSVVGLWGAIRVVTHKKPVYSALYFVLVVVAVSGLLLLLNAEFLAAALLIIYAGAILVTYVFVIMLAQQNEVAAYDRDSRDPLMGCLMGFVLLSVIGGGLTGGVTAPGPTGLTNGAGTVEVVGTSLLTTYVVGVEVAGVLLLASMVGAIAIARRRTVEQGDVPC